jgi:hypothetical protein
VRSRSVLRQLAQQQRVLHLHVAAVGGDRVADEAREVGAEGQHQQRHEHVRHEPHHAAEQVGDVGQAQAVEGDEQRRQDDQPIHQHAEDGGGVAGHAALAQEAVEARALGEHGEVDGAHRLHDGEARHLGEQPARDDHHHCDQQARQEGADLEQDGPCGLEVNAEISMCLSGCRVSR